MDGVVNVNVVTLNGRHWAFGAISNKAGHLPKRGKCSHEELDVLLSRLDKDGIIIGIE